MAAQSARDFIKSRTRFFLLSHADEQLVHTNRRVPRTGCNHCRGRRIGVSTGLCRDHFPIRTTPRRSSGQIGPQNRARVRLRVGRAPVASRIIRLGSAENKFTGISGPFVVSGVLERMYTRRMYPSSFSLLLYTSWERSSSSNRTHGIAIHALSQRCDDEKLPDISDPFLRVEQNNPPQFARKSPDFRKIVNHRRHGPSRWSPRSIASLLNRRSHCQPPSLPSSFAAGERTAAPDNGERSFPENASRTAGASLHPPSRSRLDRAHKRALSRARPATAHLKPHRSRKRIRPVNGFFISQLL